MRKQTKIAAVVSAAALLALGASITSFAAARGTWAMTDGEWYCYDKNGEPYTETFCSSNGKEYYVGEDGAIVRSSWVDYAEGIYFVNSSGAKITSDWRLTTPFEDEDADEEWFYFGSNGKRTENKKIVYKGNTYFFDGEGKMLTGWVTYENVGDSNQAVDEANGFSPNYTYYCDETGARVTSDWVKTVAPEDIENNDASEHWYYFKSTGKAATGRQNNVKGQTYFFDVENGQMLSGWVAKTTATDSNVAYEELDDDDEIHQYEEVYFCGGSNDGHMKKNKWILEYAPAEEEEEDENKNYYWIKKNGVVFTADLGATASDSNAYLDAVRYDFEEGKLVVADNQPNVVEKLNVSGKYYYFNEDGEMLSGFAKLGGNMYYFGGSKDGAMKTGAQTIRDDTDEAYRFYFSTKTSTKGQGLSKKQGGKLYYNGMLIKAIDYKYEVVDVDGKYYIVNQNGTIQSSAKEYKEDDVVVIDAEAAIFTDAAGKKTDYFENLDAVKIEQGNMVDASNYVFGN